MWFVSGWLSERSRIWKPPPPWLGSIPRESPGTCSSPACRRKCDGRLRTGCVRRNSPAAQESQENKPPETVAAVPTELLGLMTPAPDLIAESADK